MSTRRTAVLLALVVTLGACQDATLTPAATPPGSMRQASAPAQAVVVDRFGEIPSFRQEVRVSGSLKPGMPIQIHVSSEALHPAQDVEMRLVLPEAELARVGGWKHMNTVVRGRLASRAEFRGGMGRGQVVQRHTTIVIPHPGYYRAILTTRVVSGETQVDGHPILGIGVRTIWLYVHPDGGWVTDEPDPSLLPAGPLQPVQLASAPTEIDDGSGGGGSSGGGTPTTTSRVYRLVYYNLDASALQGVPNATVWIGLTNTVRTDDDGYVTVPCPASSVRADFENQYVDLDQGAPSIPNACGEPQAPGEVKQVLFTGVWADVAHVFSNTTRAAARAATFFGRSRGKVKVVLKLTDNSRYQDDHIEIKYDVFSSDVSKGHIWGEFASFVQAHEYGHAFHHKALGGLPDDPGDGCQIHELWSLESAQCAWQEGLADYISVATLPDENNYYNVFDVGSGMPLNPDGSRLEGAVAGLLVDVAGAYNRAPTQPAANGIYLGTLLATCRGQVLNLAWENVWSVGSLVYCMERQVDPWIRQNGFFTSDFPVTNQSSSATPPAGWTVSAIRKKWLWDLYRISG